MKSVKLFFAKISLFMLIMGAQLVMSHSWLENVQVEAKKAIGYIRTYNGRDTDVDRHNSYLMASMEAPVCKQSQQSPVNSSKFPRLKAAPGDRVIALHTENGHVSLPFNPQAKSGLTYWFGTTDSEATPALGDVLEWKDAGEEQDGPGRYMGASTYDDGKCAEPNHSPISAERGVGPTGQPKLCKDAGFDVPKGLKPGSIFTVYWVWDYSEHFGPGTGAFEWYSSCFDIDIVAGDADDTENASATTPAATASTAIPPAATKTSPTGNNSTATSPTAPPCHYNAPSRARSLNYGPAEAF